jgi:hypothetical protein
VAQSRFFPGGRWKNCLENPGMGAAEKAIACHFRQPARRLFRQSFEEPLKLSEILTKKERQPTHCPFTGNNPVDILYTARTPMPPPSHQARFMRFAEAGRKERSLAP